MLSSVHLSVNRCQQKTRMWISLTGICFASLGVCGICLCQHHESVWSFSQKKGYIVILCWIPLLGQSCPFPKILPKTLNLKNFRLFLWPREMVTAGDAWTSCSNDWRWSLRLITHSFLTLTWWVSPKTCTTTSNSLFVSNYLFSGREPVV